LNFKTLNIAFIVLMRTIRLLSSEAMCVELGARIKRLRLMRNLSQKEVADMVLASLSSIRRLESHGQGSLLLLVRVANAVQAVGQFDSLFNEPILSIAQAERNEALSLRKRARTPRALKS
jgi:transcriptional regulator with XRE-family HTH domain